MVYVSFKLGLSCLGLLSAGTAGVRMTYLSVFAQLLLSTQ